MAQSVWNASSVLPKFETLHGTKKADILVIGGGMCGILCAWFLKEAGADVILVEADRIGSGMTGNTTAKITSQHGLIYDRLIRSKGSAAAGAYLRANESALAKYRRMAGWIDCDFEEKAAYVYSRSDKKKLEREVQAVNALGFPAQFAPHLPLPFQTVGGVMFPRQAQFHPLKFLAGLAGRLRIYEHTFITELSEHTAKSKDAQIHADQIVVATHFPFLNRHGSYFLKLYQSRSYVIALEGAPDVGGMYIDEAEDGLSLRNYGNLLFVGGGGHRTGKRGGAYQELRKKALDYYPDAKEVYHWAAQDCMSLDGIPYIGTYSARTEGLYTASGFNKWGMTGSMVSALILRDYLLGVENEWEEAFCPGRSMLTRQLFANGAEAAWNLLTPTAKRCPHMGCALKWNPQEHTWDCPCHGSRFEEDGTLISNPAMGGARVE